MRKLTKEDSLDKILEMSAKESRDFKISKRVSSFLYGVATLNSLLYITNLATALHYGRFPGDFTDFILLYTVVMCVGFGKVLSHHAEDLRYKGLAELVLKYKK